MHAFVLGPNRRLYTGDFLVSSRTAYHATVQSDGNLCIYPGSKAGPGDTDPKWCALKTPQPEGRYFIVLEDDGDFVIYRETAGDPPGKELVWSTGTGGGTVGTHYQVILSDRGCLNLFEPGSTASQPKIRWTSCPG
jgi:hypothetical protein